MIDKKTSTIYETSDLQVASFLKTNKIPLHSLRRENSRVHFRFSDPRAEALAISFLNDAAVPAASYARSLQELKALIYGRIE